jgi:RNA polymerase sigma-70 factor (ECF subfamily)
MFTFRAPWAPYLREHNPLVNKRAPVPERAQVHRQGEVDLEAVYREQGDRLWRALVGFTGNWDIAAEAVSEAFAQALGRREQIRDPAAWVWKAAFRIATGELQRYRRSPPTPMAGSYRDPEPPTDLIKALSRLSRNQRGAVLLHHYAGYPVRDVARILGSTPTAVRVHLMRGRRRLRQLLEDHDDA